MSKIYNISVSNCFVDTLAQKLLKDYQNNELQLAEVLILLPNRRACRSLAEAFVRLRGLHPTLLPQMRAIGDTEEDELLINDIVADRDFLNLPPAISSLERTLLLTKLITNRYQEFGLERISLGQACGLAAELGSLLDNVALRKLDWNNLQNIVPDQYSIHWQETLKFLTIVTRYWPDILAEREVIDASTRRNILLHQQCLLWQNSATTQKIIIAGTTAVSPAMKEMVRTVINLPNGEIYLAGLDKHLDQSAWEKIDETHPQFELKQLLDYLNISRDTIPDLLPPTNIEREILISEIMRPATCSDKWRELKGTLSDNATSGIKLIECRSTREEALNIAVLIRQALETPEQTIALVTPDRQLARRTSSELGRWGIMVDDSAGIPLLQSPWGIFIRSVITAAAQSAKSSFLSLLKHCLFSYGSDFTNLRPIVERIDKNLWRLKEEDAKADLLLRQITNEIASLSQMLQQPSVSFDNLIKTHITIAEKLSSIDGNTSNLALWSNEDGQTGAAFISELLEKAALIGDINPLEYLELLEALMSGIMVHNTQKTHPRIKILGPLEARLNHYNTIIIGGCTEGIWPTFPSSDPWMSRPMKRDFGLGLPEQQIGVTALDFANLLGASKVYLTSCCLNDGAQTVKSRWWMRLITVLQALDINIDTLYYTTADKLGKWLDTPAQNEIVKLKPPAPTPPVKDRPHRLSASAFEKLLRDPYGVFAEYILKLKPLDDLETFADQSDFGNLVHQVLDEFTNLYPKKFPDDAEEILLSLGKKAFNEADFSSDKTAFWLPKFHQIIQWFVATEKEYRPNITKVKSEINGSIFFDKTDMGTFEIYARADRIDCTIDGKYNIIDYKTGQARTAKEIKSGYAPQLPIEALIASSGGFTELPASEVSQLMYWKLGDKVITVDTEIEKLISDTREHIIEIVNKFAHQETGYLSRPNPKHVPAYSDYEHLARVKEWSVKDDGEDN